MVFKCKMCGGDITKIKGTNIGKCIYCKSEMTLPDSDNEKIINLYNRANFLRMENDFAKAKEMYESILTLDNNQLEAHWGILLCKYGVEYVDDPKTKKKVPTCHRTEDKSILNDADFKMIQKNAVGDVLSLYEQEAHLIDEIQKGILLISKKEKPYDVFLCYKETEDDGERTQDSVIAEDIYHKLVEQGLKVFFSRITLESKLGKEYEPYIYSALKTSKVMLVVGTTEEHFQAVWVKNEWSRFLEMMKQDKSKSLIPVYSKMDVYKLPEEFVMLQAQSMDKIGAMQDLVRGVQKLLLEYQNSDSVEENLTSSDVRSIGNGNYEVTIYKENLPIWYYGFIGVAIFFGFIFLAGMLAVDFSYGTFFGQGVSISLLDNFPALGSFFLAALSYAFCLFSTFLGRKFYRFRKKALIFGTCFLIASYFVMATQGYFLYYEAVILHVILMGCIVIFYFINPSWKLNVSSKTIMNFEDKEKQVQKNLQIQKNFCKKEKVKVHFVWIVLPILFFLIWGIFLWNQNFNSSYRSNSLDTTVDQVKIQARTLYLYQNTDQKHVIGFVKKNEVYTVLDFVGNDGKYGNKLQFLKIRLKDETEGYLPYSNYLQMLWSDNSSIFSKYFKQSNERDTSKKQVQVIEESINVRASASVYSEKMGEVYLNEIYTVLEEKVESGDVWIRIEASNHMKGWIAAKYQNVSYVKEI